MGDGTQLLALPLGDKPARRLSVGLVQGVASAPFALLNPMTWMGIYKLR